MQRRARYERFTTHLRGSTREGRRIVRVIYSYTTNLQKFSAFYIQISPVIVPGPVTTSSLTHMIYIPRPPREKWISSSRTPAAAYLRPNGLLRLIQQRRTSTTEHIHIIYICINVYANGHFSGPREVTNRLALYIAVHITIYIQCA